jgi:hypothetical protein
VKKSVPSAPAHRAGKFFFSASPIRLGNGFRIARHLSALRQNQPEILFIADPRHYRFNLLDKLYSYLLDPWVEFASRTYKVAKLELEIYPENAGQARFLPAVFFPAPVFGQKIQPVGTIANFAALNACLKGCAPGVELDEKDIITRIVRIQRRSLFFQAALRVASPRAVFLINYYNEKNMALVDACRRQGVAVVDVQHGKQGKFHGMYSHWTRIPPDGFSLLPDYFWVWGEESRLNILQGRQGNNAQHQPLVGGNLWMQKWKTDDWRVMTPAEQRFKESLRAYTRVVLFSAQPIAQVIPPQLLDAMQAAPPNWLWLIRLHPRQRADLPAIATAVESRRRATL